ncbi:MAG TPA: ABC transporter permease [Tepidisphaeraceae bacterium]|jgi:putative ABC transport system permease protein|nr:ABC transporter permease [Tepidisphaeraceae bacterium]
MNLFQLVIKQMRQRALSTWLTLLSVMLGVGLAVAIMILYRAGNDLFVQSDFGYDIIMGPPKGSPLQLVLNTVYGLDQPPGNMPYSVYENLLKNPRQVRIAVPITVGDSYKNLRIIGTLPKMFGFDDQGQKLPEEKQFEYRLGKHYEMAEGRVFHPEKFEAVIGSDVGARTGLKIGSTFRATHGMPGPNETPDIHEQDWTVVGILAPTHTAADRVLYIPIISNFAISEHEKGMAEQADLRSKLSGATAPVHAHHDYGEEAAAYKLRPDGTIDLTLPKDEWLLSAVLVKSRNATLNLMYQYKVIDPSAVAVNPATTMREFFDTFFKSTTLVLLMIAILVSIVAAVGILVSIYNSVSARMREIAILRALGATRVRILALICVEAGLIGAVGGLLGLIAGHLVAASGSAYMNKLLGQSIRWGSTDRFELLYFAGVVLIAVVAGLVPALKAYRTPVATNLVAV